MIGRGRQNIGERRHARGGVGEADLEGEQERNEEENQQEQQRRQNDEPTARTLDRFHQSRRNKPLGAIVRDKLSPVYKFRRLAPALSPYQPSCPPPPLPLRQLPPPLAAPSRPAAAPAAVASVSA